MLELRTLGTLQLRDAADGREIGSVLARSKPTALLLYLALARPRGPHLRDKLLGLFWPETTESRARDSLTHALHVLREGLGSEALVTHGNAEVGLNSEKVWCDATAFDEMLDEGRSEEALQLYQGDLLDGFYVSDAPNFERWLDEERERLRRRAVEAVLALAAQEEAEGNLTGASTWIRWAISLEPYDEALLGRLLLLLHSAGDRSGAVREYEAFEKRLAEDLDLEPSADTTALIEKFRAEDLSASQPPDAHELERPRLAEAAAAGSKAGDGSVPPAASPPTVRHSERRFRPSIVAIAAMMTLILGGVAGWTFLTGSGGSGGMAPVQNSRVLVMEFENETGDPSLDVWGGLAASWITRGLELTELIDVVPTATMLREVSSLRADQQLANGESFRRAVASLTGATLLVSGAYDRWGDSLRLKARFIDPTTGELLGVVGPVWAPASDERGAVHVVAQRTIGALAAMLDPRLSSWQQEASQPPSLEAYRRYAYALDMRFSLGGMNQTREWKRETADRFLEAAALDSTFKTPLLWAVQALRSADDWERADSLAKALSGQRTHLTRWEEALLDYELASFRRDYLGTYEAMSRVVARVRDSEWEVLLALSALRLNRPREAADRLANLDPERGWLSGFSGYWSLLAHALHLSGDHEAELRHVRRGKDMYGTFLPYLLEARALVGLGRTTAAIERAKQAEGGEQAPFVMSMTILDLHAHGHAAEAIKASEYFLATYYDTLPPAGRSLGTSIANALVMVGRLEEAHAAMKEWSEQFTEPYWPTLQPFGIMGVMEAKLGNREEAWRWSERLKELEDPNRSGNNTLWRARIAAQLGDTDEALALFRQALDEGGFHVPIALHLDPHLDPLRGDPAFQELMRPKG